MKNMKLKAAREASGKTQAQVAKETEISETHYQNIEYDKNKPSAEVSIRIAEALGIEEFSKYKEIFGAATPEE